MRLGIGIDTGGTYTDAVLYDFDRGCVLHTAKSPTTHDDLARGITDALQRLPTQHFPAVGLAALSTTLATNACVEGKGGRARLLLLGVRPEGAQARGGDSGLPDAQEIRFLPCKTTIDGRVLEPPDWSVLRENAAGWFAGDDAICIVETHAMRNGGVLEYQARELLAEQFPAVPIICGNDLFDDLYVFQRAASALLNGGLLPVVGAFLQAIHQVFRAQGLNMPRVTVRSDGTLMNEEMTAQRPVDTLLSGPAASVCGGLALSGAGDCILADMGGTTTDVALAMDGAPLRARDGIRVGRWRTFAKGLDIDTFALGGDTGVRVESERPVLLYRRFLPLCVLAQQYPSIKKSLCALADEVPRHTLPLHEAFVLMRDVPDADPRYDETEHKLIAALRQGPLLFADAANATGLDKYMLRPERLEREGIIQRAGLTPTDIMHIKGDYTRFDAQAAVPALKFLARCAHKTPEQLADEIYDLVKQRLYVNLVRILMERRQPALRRDGLPEALETYIKRSWRAFKGGKRSRFLQPQFTCNATLVGLGAPMRLFLPDVAAALGAPCSLPEYAEVANAVGAICGSIRAEVSAEVRQAFHGPEGEPYYYLLGMPDGARYDDLESAQQQARLFAEQRAIAEARARGAKGKLTVTFQDAAHGVEIGGAMTGLAVKITAIAVGAAGFDA